MQTTVKLPRGIRNNNPGNIRLSKIKWQGQKFGILCDKEFVEFTEPVYGVRAIMKLLLTYHFKYGLDTVTSIINRYAPPCENATDGYIYHVSKILNIGQNKIISLRDSENLKNFSKAIICHENGNPPKDMPEFWYADDVYNQALNLAKDKE